MMLSELCFRKSYYFFMMKSVMLITLVLFAKVSFGQTDRTITIIDFVKVNSGKQREALFFYENNWKVYRDIALDSGYIKAYRLLTTSVDSVADFDIMLITEYTDSLQFSLSEERFQKIMKSIRPQGPRLLNELKPADFRRNLFFRQTKTLYSSEVLSRGLHSKMEL